MSDKLCFASDYMEGAHPAILNRLLETNLAHTAGYGLDEYSEAARGKIRAACHAPEAGVFFLVGGTQTNATVIDALLRPWQGVVAAETGHISVHEAGAIEFGGHKVLTLPQKDGKVTAAQVARCFDAWRQDENREHLVMPGMVYISQPTEYGTLYSLSELEALGEVCRRAGAEDEVGSAREKSWHGRLRRDLQVVRETIIRNSDVQSVLTVLALVLMIAVYMLFRRRELDMEKEKAKAKSYFFSTVSHDIRTPLNAIIGFSEMLKSGFSTEAERVQAEDAIIASGKTLLGLVNDVLDLSKLESGKMEILPEPTDCTKLLREVTDAFKVASGKAGIEVRCRVDEMPPMMVDPQRIRQMLFNLVGNAVKFTHEGYVEIYASFVRADEQSGTLRIEVADTGCGISKEDLARIGSAYVQVGSKLSRNGGTGLGLAICKQLSAAMGGRLNVESELGKGSTFSVTIPGVKTCEAEGLKADGMPAHVAPVHPASESGSPRRILIVDDSKMNIMVLKAQLKNLGKFEVVSAGDGQEALETLRSPGAGRFDLVLTDMWMPRLDGSGLVKAIRADPTLSDMRVVVVTADVEFRAKFAEIGFDSLLLKPITKASLAEALEMEGR